MARQQTHPQRRGQRGGTDRPAGGGTPPSMPSRRAWLAFALILLANFLLVRFLFPLTIPDAVFEEGLGILRAALAEAAPC